MQSKVLIALYLILLSSSAMAGPAPSMICNLNLQTPPHGYVSISDDDLRKFIQGCINYDKGQSDSTWLEVTGWGVDEDYLESDDIFDTVDALNAVRTNRPIVVRAVDKSIVLINENGIRALGLTANSGDPVGGEIWRDQDGVPFGILSGTAINLIKIGAKPVAPVAPQPPKPVTPTAPQKPAAPQTPVSQPMSPLPKPGLPKVFDVRRDGFSFPNYGNDRKSQDLNADVMERLCGSSSCERKVNNQCVLSGAGRVFMNEMNSSMGGGHCEGMATLALALFAGKENVRKYDANSNTTYDLKFNNQSLQRDIAYYFSMQGTEPAISSTIELSPRDTVNKLRKNEDLYIVGIYEPDGSQGHAVSFERVIDDSPTKSRIAVYDNNFPGHDQYITVDMKNNTMSYPGYRTGTAKSRSITLHPLSTRFLNQQCMADGNDDDRYAHDGRWYVWLDGPGRLVAPQGAREIRRRDTGFLSQSPMYEVESDCDVSLAIEGVSDAQIGETKVVVARHGQVLALEGLKLQAGEVDKLKMGKDGDSFTYATKDPENIVVRLGLTYKGDDFEVKLAPIVKDSGYELNIKNNIDKKDGHHVLDVSLHSEGDEQGAYAVELTRIGKVDDQHFVHKHELKILPHETDHLEYGKWVKTGQPLEVKKDLDSDGKNEEEDMVNDED